MVCKSVVNCSFSTSQKDPFLYLSSSLQVFYEWAWIPQYNMCIIIRCEIHTKSVALFSLLVNWQYVEAVLNSFHIYYYSIINLKAPCLFIYLLFPCVIWRSISCQCAVLRALVSNTIREVCTAFLSWYWFNILRLSIEYV